MAGRGRPKTAVLLLMPIMVGLSVVGRPSRVKVATASPKEEGFLRELAEQPSLKLRYRFYEPVH